MKLNGVIRIFSVFVFFLLNFSCTPKDTKNNYDKIPFLHQSKGTKNYEVNNLSDWGKVHWDIVKSQYLIETSDYYYKYSASGDKLDSFTTNQANNINNFAEDHYSTWIDDNDKSLKYYIDITPNQKPIGKDTIEYIKNHLEFYKKSSIVKYAHQDMDYYYYYKNKWYRMKNWGARYIRKDFPEKLPPTRLLNIASNPNPPNNVKQLYIPRKKVKLTSDAIGAPKNFTLGTYIVRVGLPGGDSLIYRRFGDRLGNLTKFYQLPGSKGGNDSILFISQEYNNQDGYFSHGGLFMIKPKKKK